ncbi:MAG: DUF554 domain-containing protein [Candidatus Symbiothrix sp.]|jgi:uncharacterized membrane protein YqgA involved in biofilm formation|nr:DUF554 domain-containing protein [Candidatus Symbiothrix sp.]
MTGTLVNAGAIIAGSAIGLIFKTRLAEKYQTLYFQAVGLFTLVLGVQMALGMTYPLLVILSLVVGGFLGERLQLESKADNLGNFIQQKIHSRNERFTEGITTAFLLFCMGSMTVIGAIEEGFGKTSDLLLTKSVMDFFSAIMLAAGLGIGVLMSFIPLLLFQGGITLLVASAGKDIPPIIISELTAVGGIILISLGFSLTGIKKLNVLNFLPALALIVVFVWLWLKYS